MATKKKVSTGNTAVEAPEATPGQQLQRQINDIGDRMLSIGSVSIKFAIGFALVSLAVFLVCGGAAVAGGAIIGLVAPELVGLGCAA